MLAPFNPIGLGVSSSDLTVSAGYKAFAMDTDSLVSVNLPIGYLVQATAVADNETWMIGEIPASGWARDTLTLDVRAGMFNDNGSATSYSAWTLKVVGPKSPGVNAQFYVRTDGSDSNSGLVDTAAGAFLSIQAAVNAASLIDLSLTASNRITINVGAGTYTNQLFLHSLKGYGDVLIIGDQTTPSNVVISTTSDSCVTCGLGCHGTYSIAGFKFQTTTAGRCIDIGSGESGGGAVNSRLSPALIVDIGKVEFGAAPSGHIRVGPGAAVNHNSSYTINGAAPYHWQIIGQGHIRAEPTITVTVTGTPAFSTAFADVQRGGYLDIDNITFSGGATGTRYTVSLNGVIYTNGGGASYIPGNAAGTVATGGVYDSTVAYYGPGGTDVALADGGTGASLVDPNADRIFFWDDSAGLVDWLAPGTGMSITGTSLNTSAYLPAGTDVALADGGTGASLADPNADRIMFWDDSAGAMDWLVLGTNLTITGTTLDATGGSGTAASQAEQEAASSLTVFTSPGRQHFHPGMPKAIYSATITPTAVAGAATSWDTATDICLWNAVHGLTTGDTIIMVTNAPAGSTVLSPYYVNVVDTTHFSLHTTLAGALAGTGKVNVTTSVATTMRKLVYSNQSPGATGYGMSAVSPVTGVAATTTIGLVANFSATLSSAVGLAEVATNVVDSSPAAQTWVQPFATSMTTATATFTGLKAPGTTGLTPGTWSQQGTTAFTVTFKLWGDL